MSEEDGDNVLSRRLQMLLEQELEEFKSWINNSNSMMQEVTQTYFNARCRLANQAAQTSVDTVSQLLELTQGLDSEEDKEFTILAAWYCLSFSPTIPSQYPFKSRRAMESIASEILELVLVHDDDVSFDDILSIPSTIFQV